MCNLNNIIIMKKIFVLISAALLSCCIAVAQDMETATNLAKEANEALKKLKADQAASEKDSSKATAEYYRDVIKADMEALRAPVDVLETIVDAEYWPIPTYGDLLFEA